MVSESWVQTGNPFWSFFLNVFPTRNWDALGATYLIDFINKPNLPLTLPNFFYAFWLISADYGKIGPFSFRLGWAYLAAIPLLILAFWKMTHPNKRWIAWLGAVSVILYVSWFFQTHQARFFMPAVPLIALAVGGAASALDNWKLPLSRSVVLLGIIGIVLANSWVVQPAEIALLRSNMPYLWGVSPVTITFSPTLIHMRLSRTQTPVFPRMPGCFWPCMRAGVIIWTAAISG